MDPLMITASCGLTRPAEPGTAPQSVAEIVEAVHACFRAGAAIAQIRAPFTVNPSTGQAAMNMEDWSEIIRRIRERCDILIQVGVAGMPVDARIEMLKTARPDISAFLITHHDIVVGGHHIYQLLSWDDAVRSLRAHVELGVVPEFEIFHGGALWNLKHFLTQVSVPKPLALALFFWEGGLWAPPNVEELLRRIEELPKESSYCLATAHGPEHVLMHAVAIARGGHVRVGFGDHYPYFTEGVQAESSVQLVQRMVRLAAALNREVATPQSAAKLLGIRSHG